MPTMDTNDGGGASGHSLLDTKRRLVGGQGQVSSKMKPSSFEGHRPKSGSAVSLPSPPEKSAAPIDFSIKKRQGDLDQSQIGPRRLVGGQADSDKKLASSLMGPGHSEKMPASLEGRRRPNSSEVLIPFVPDDSTTQFDAREAIGISTDDLSAQLLEHDRNAKNWTQQLNIIQDDGSTCNVGCALRGTLSRTPPNAINQPNKYPRQTCIRLPTSLKGKDAFPRVKMLLENGGPLLTIRQVPSESRSSAQRQSNWTLCCHGHRINPGKTGQFKAGKAAMSGIRHQPKLRQKTAGSKKRGIQAMYSKSAKAQLPPPAHAPNAPNRRTKSGAAKNKESRCTFVLNLFVAQDDYWYLSQLSNLNHKGHPRIPPSAHSIGMRELNKEDSQFISICSDVGIEGSKIAKLLERMKGEEGVSGTIVPKAIYNMSESTKKMAELSKGITSDMDDAEKIMTELRL